MKISDFSLLLRHELPLNFLSIKMQHWILTLTDRCLELWMHVTLYSPKDYLKAFWKRNTKVISIAFINSWSRLGKGSKGLIVELQDKETELVGEQLPLGVKNTYMYSWYTFYLFFCTRGAVKQLWLRVQAGNKWRTLVSKICDLP